MVLVATTPDNGLMSGFSAYANLSYLNELLNLGPGEYQTFGIYLPSLNGMDRYADAFYTALKAARERARTARRPQTTARAGMGPMAAFFGGGATEETWTGVRYRVSTLDDLLSSVKQIVNVLNSVSIGILIVLFVIIMVGILNTFRMTMYERIREIGTMRALGDARARACAISSSWKRSSSPSRVWWWASRRPRWSWACFPCSTSGRLAAFHPAAGRAL